MSRTTRPENVLDHLEREAFYGVGTAMAMGDQPMEFAIKFQQNQLPGNIRLRPGSFSRQAWRRQEVVRIRS